MFTSLVRLMPASLRTYALAVGFVLAAVFSTSGAGLATTDPNAGVPDNTVDTAFSEMCDRAVATFEQEIEWILEFMDENPGFDPNDPELAAHRDRMWNAWAFAEFRCFIDVGGDGEIG